MENLNSYKRDNFESTCDVLGSAIDNGEISTQYIMEDTAPNCIYPDDVRAIEQWITNQAEILHIDD